MLFFIHSSLYLSFGDCFKYQGGGGYLSEPQQDKEAVGATRRDLNQFWGVFFSGETIKDIMELCPYPVDRHVSLRTTEKWASLLACLPCIPKDIEALWMWEYTAEEAHQKRTPQ
jgi:hypothetical protein